MKEYRNVFAICLFLVCSTFLGYHNPAEAMPIIAAMAGGLGVGIYGRGYNKAQENGKIPPRANG